MHSLLQMLVQQDGFSFWRKGYPAHQRQVIEIFPSEAIWSLGIQGRFRNRTSSEVRAYKHAGPRRISRQVAKEQATAALAGFKELFKSPLTKTLPVQRWIEQIADHACDIGSSGNDSVVSKGKGFDDPVESGISLLTTVAFVVGDYHAWGDGSDGTIVGPGRSLP
jgi:hypothetical protein